MNNQDLHFYGDATTFLNKELESKYKNLINLKNFFEYLHISYSFEFKDLNKNEIDALINISNIFEIKKGNIKNGLYFVNIGEKRIFIDIYNYKDELVILNPFEENGIFKIYLETRNEKIETSSVVLIKDDLTNILNFDLNYYKKVILELVKEECLDEIDSLILNLITAFDKTKEIRYLKCTEEIYLEIMKISDNVNYYINLMQCYKRERELNNEEIGKLMNIYSNLTDTQEDIMRKFCIDVILENKGNSLLYYKKMDEEAKEFMNKLPIINLYNIQNKFN